MDMSLIIKSIVSLFLIMLAGVYGRKKGFINDSVSAGLTNILLEIALPCMIVSSFNFTYDASVKSNVIRTFYFSIAVYIFIAVISLILLHPIKNEKKTILHFSNVFTNTGYIGFPILNAIYGTEAVMYGSIFNIFFTIFLWTYGIMMFKGSFKKRVLSKEVLKALKNPSLIAVYIGITMMVFDLKMPDVIMSSTSAVGNMTGPLSMIIVGALCCKVNIKEYLTDWTIYYGTVVKLILIPAALCVISQLINDNSIVLNSVIILASMPAAAMTSIFADSFDIKRGYASVVVVSTTLFSIFTLPLLLKVLI